MMCHGFDGGGVRDACALLVRVRGEDGWLDPQRRSPRDHQFGTMGAPRARGAHAGCLGVAHRQRAVDAGDDARGVHAAGVRAGGAALARAVWSAQCREERLSARPKGFRRRSRRLLERARDDGSGAGAAGDRRVERVSGADGIAARASGRRAAPRERGERERQRAPAHVDAGGARRPRARADSERPGDRRRASSPRRASRSARRRDPLPEHEDQRGQGRSPGRIGSIRPENAMSRRRHDRWLLIRLAAQNVGRRRLRAIFLGVAVMLGVGIGFASFVASWALREGMARSFSRMGADLLVVPRATLVNITASLLTVQPTDETLPADLAQRIAAIPGVAQVAPQRVAPALVEGHDVNLIAFDPAQNFSVLSWVEARQAGALEGLIAGAALSARLGETLSVCGMPMRVSARLGKTGVGPFDDSYFLSFAALADIVSFCRASDARAAPKPAAPAQRDNAPAIDGMRHGDAKVCPGDLPLDRVSAFLLQLSPGAKMEEVKFGLAQLADVKIVEGNGVLTSSRQALSTLLIGMAPFTAFQLTALLILVSLLFSAIVQERYREVGLLRAMGAQPNQVMTIILAEAAVITAMGGLAGLGFGAAVLLTFARSLGFYFALLGVPFSWPPAAVLQIGAVLAIVFSAVLGLVGAFLPAWRVRRMAPYALIQAEGR